MVKIWSNSHIFKYSWESVTNVWWQKYPNPHSLQVDSVDTIDRRFDKLTGSLITRRLIAASLAPPTWMAALGFPTHCYVLEEVTCNPKNKTMTLKSKNLTGNSLLEIQETCKYYPNKSNKNETVYEQSAEIISNVPFFGRNIELYSLGIHSGNAFKGLSAMEELCNKWSKIGLEGFQSLLKNRLDTILLLDNIKDLQNQMKQFGLTVPNLSFPTITIPSI